MWQVDQCVSETRWGGLVTKDSQGAGPEGTVTKTDGRTRLLARVKPEVYSAHCICLLIK